MSLYITGVDIQGESNKEVSKMTKTFKNSDKKHKKEISSFVSKNQENFEKTTSKMLDYLVNEETNYTDMIKIEEYLKSKNLNHYKKYNIHAEAIRKKKDLVKTLELQISEVSY